MLATTAVLIGKRRYDRNTIDPDYPTGGPSSASAGPAHPATATSTQGPTSSTTAGSPSFRRQSVLTRAWSVIQTVQYINLLDALQSLLAIASSLLWMVQSYPPYDSELKIVWIQFVLTIAYMIDLITRTTLQGIVYLQTLWALFDLATCLPILYLMYLLGFYSDDGSEATRGFIAFVTALTVVWQWLILCRFLRIFKLLRLTELRSATFLFNSELVRGIMSLVITVLAFIVLGGALIFLIENAYSYGEPMTFQQSLYFMVVTISTVGYGDITPRTIVGQTAIMVIILIAIIIVPLQTADLVSSITAHYKFGLPYTSRIPHIVVVAAATMTADDLDTLLYEFFHSHVKLQPYRLVLLCSGGEDHRSTLLHHVKSTQYWNQVSYIVGSPSSTDDLDKAAVRHASAVFLLTSASFIDPEQEMASDEQTLLRAISIKHYCPYVPLVISLNSPRNRAHVLWFQLSKFPAIQTVCLTEIKMRLLATSAWCPGVLGVLINLLSCYDGKANMASLFSSESALETTASNSDDGDCHSAMPAFTAQAVAEHSLSVAAWPLTSARCPADVLPPGPASGEEQQQHSLFYSAASRQWEEEYLFGFGQELRTCELPSALDGLAFADVAAALYERLLLVLLAVHRMDPKTGKARVMLNPGYAARLFIQSGDLLCVLAQSADHAAAVSTVDWADMHVRLRWRRQRDRDAIQHIPPVQRLASSFRSHDASIIPAIPIDSAVAQYNILQAELRRRRRDVQEQHDSTVTYDDNVGSDDPSHALAQYVDDKGVAVDPDTGISGSSSSVLEVKQDAAAENDRADARNDDQDKPTGENNSGSHMGNQADAAGGAGGAEPFAGHVVLCGYIDSRIIGFIRRFRASDARPIVLVLDTAVCYPMPAIAHQYISRNFRDVHILYSAQSFKGRHQKDRVFLAYTDPCFGHHHYPAPRPQLRADVSSTAVAASVSSHGGVVESAAENLQRPVMPFDEFGDHDRRVERALHKSDSSGGLDSAGPGPDKSDCPARYARLCDDEPEGGDMDNQAMLEHGSWYRRAAVHRADVIFILANRYSAPPDSTSSDGGGAVNEESSVSSSQQLLTSLFTSGQHTLSLLAADEQAKGDQHSVILYSGLQAYLHQCHTNPCPAVAPPVGRQYSPSVAVELLFHTNVRLLKHDADATESYEPHQPEVTGWRWLMHALVGSCGKESEADARRQRVRDEMERKRARHKHALFAQLKGECTRRERGLDDDDNNEDDSAEEDDDELRAAVAGLLDDYADAFYTSDGLMLSAKLLDSLIVQAYAEPLIYDTVTALVGGYNHAIPSREFAAATGGVKVAGDGESSEGLRSFRVEVVLLDVPAAFVSRSFGFLQLTLMIENGWIALGLYRDRQQVTRHSRRALRRARPSRGQFGGGDGQRQTKEHGKATNDRYAGFSEERDVIRDTGGPAAADKGRSDGARGGERRLPYSERSRFFVLTNPPPDTILHSRDRIYAVLQRWTQPDTAERMLTHTAAKNAPVRTKDMVDRSRPQRAPPLPASYSPRGSDATSIPAPSDDGMR